MEYSFDVLVTLATRVAPELKQRLQQEAAQLGVTLSEYTSQLLCTQVSDSTRNHALEERLLKAEVEKHRLQEKLDQLQTEHQVAKEDLVKWQTETPLRLEKVIQAADQEGLWTSKGFRTRLLNLFHQPVSQ